MSFWTARNLRMVTGGSWLRKPAPPPAPPPAPGRDDAPLVEGVSTDTRAIKPGQAFLALRGERFDAHDFLDSAIGAGAALLIIDAAGALPDALLRSPTGPSVLKVADTRRALGQLAAAYRKSLEGTKVIAVVGSNGKTTVTKLIHGVLSARLRGSCSPKSFNNDVGVPLTILGAKPGDQYLVCEVGSNHPGETARLARIVQPDIAVVTSIGRDHMEFFASLDEVAREHAAIFTDLRPGGLAIVPQGEALLSDFLKPVANVVTFGTSAAADLRASAIEHTAQGVRFTLNERSVFDLPLLGEHNAMNALGAIAVARRLGLDDASIAKGLASARAPDMRLNRRTVRGADLLIDCYNANPDSLLAAARTFAAISRSATRRVLILGDMLEMGRHSDAAHRETGEAIAQGPAAELVITVGPASLHLAQALQSAWPESRFMIFSELDDASAEKIAAAIKPGDSVLLKGSRGIRLERIVTSLERSDAPPNVVGGPAASALAANA